MELLKESRTAFKEVGLRKNNKQQWCGQLTLSQQY